MTPGDIALHVEKLHTRFHELEQALAGFPFAKVGTTNNSGDIVMKSADGEIRVALEDLAKSYKSTLDGI